MHVSIKLMLYFLLVVHAQLHAAATQPQQHTFEVYLQVSQGTMNGLQQQQSSLENAGQMKYWFFKWQLPISKTLEPQMPSQKISCKVATITSANDNIIESVLKPVFEAYQESLAFTNFEKLVTVDSTRLNADVVASINLQSLTQAFTNQNRQGYSITIPSNPQPIILSYRQVHYTWGVSETIDTYEKNQLETNLDALKIADPLVFDSILLKKILPQGQPENREIPLINLGYQASKAPPKESGVLSKESQLANIMQELQQLHRDLDNLSQRISGKR